MRKLARHVSVHVSRFAEAVRTGHVQRTINRITDHYIRPGIWRVSLLIAGIVLAFLGSVSLLFVMLGIAGTSIEDFDWRGWLGIGLATGVPIFLVWQTLLRLATELQLNSRLMKSSRGRDLIDKWY